MTRQLPSLTGPQWHQGQSPRLCPCGYRGHLVFPSPSPGSPLPCPGHYPLALGYDAASALLPTHWHCRVLLRGTVVSEFPIPGQTTCRDPRSCLLYAGCIRNNVSTSWQTSRPHTIPFWPRCISHFHLCGFTALMQVSLRQHRNQVWLVNPCMAQSCHTVVPGLPTLTSATRERRPGRPYTVVHV